MILSLSILSAFFLLLYIFRTFSPALDFKRPLLLPVSRYVANATSATQTLPFRWLANGSSPPHHSFSSLLFFIYFFVPIHSSVFHPLCPATTTTTTPICLSGIVYVRNIHNNTTGLLLAKLSGRFHGNQRLPPCLECLFHDAWLSAAVGYHHFLFPRPLFCCPIPGE